MLSYLNFIFILLFAEEHKFSVHKLGEREEIHCDQCDKIFTTKKSLVRHTKHVHNKAGISVLNFFICIRNLDAWS